jgi:hypothetical protein
MNKNPLVFLNTFTRLSPLKFFSNNLLLLLVSMTFVLGSCNDDDEDFSVENYSVTITKSGNGVMISNFGDIMYVPVNATIKGNVFTIPSQTFKGKTMTIVIYGQGILNGDHLTFDYTIDTDDDFLLEHTCSATKQE